MVQQAVVTVLNRIYKADFQGFSYDLYGSVRGRFGDDRPYRDSYHLQHPGRIVANRR